MAFEAVYLQSVRKQFIMYKTLGENAIAQLSEQELYFQPESNSNSIAIIVQHLHGNMISRFTNFLTEDGEKPWRERDKEFLLPAGFNREGEVAALWAEGWDCALNAIDQLTPAELGNTIKIRQQPLLVLDAINRQLTHYASHVGQIVYLAKMIKGAAWKSLSIPKGESDLFNQEMAKKFTTG
ncbi:DUF1572 family protein [Flavihumibacter fluvii]|uniref:DUF1572 family protein n=1 Tax=Flavihumibacter fluvii TaxID=2838157 RepID=UPI001BDEC52E|nr:DUF1572 family protein [Flavihumibacter fluvii]ULQ53113.1 DUF1572 domain-containing protein [Flavihumibacter fluvii]